MMHTDILYFLAKNTENVNIDWQIINKTLLSPFYEGLLATQQNPKYHAEGSVYNHTVMVTEALVGMPSYRRRTEEERRALLLAALLHDVGKIYTTKTIDGALTSPHHAEVGERAVRAYLWRDLGLCADRERARFRETVATLVRYHMKPGYLPEYRDAQRSALRYSTEGELLPLFTMELLCILAEADVRGRIAQDTEESLERIALSRELLCEYNCYRAPYPFPSAHTRYSYLSGMNIAPGVELYDDTKLEVILLSGLPGVGKDTYYEKHLSHLPEISLDKLRAKMRVSPTEPQGEVVSRAREMARSYLRDGVSFVWNATSLTEEQRRNQIELFRKYGARTRVVYLECDYAENLRRNRERTAYVPERVIEGLLEKTRPPRHTEAHEVTWSFT